MAGGRLDGAVHLEGEAMRAMVVEDEVKIANEVGLALEAEGFEVQSCRSGEEAYFLATTGTYDVILLDRMLPGRDGVSVLEALRRHGCRTPVLMLTAVGGVEDRVEGLTAGADDYVVKPFAMTELMARVKALLRRGAAHAEREIVRGMLRLDPLTRRATWRGEALRLTSTEWDLLVMLARSPGATVSRDAIVHQLWPAHVRNAGTDNLIDVHIARLRRKLTGDGDQTPIRTVRGLGFMFEEST